MRHFRRSGHGPPRSIAGFPAPDKPHDPDCLQTVRPRVRSDADATPAPHQNDRRRPSPRHPPHPSPADHPPIARCGHRHHSRPCPLSPGRVPSPTALKRHPSGRVPKWTNGADCKSAGSAFGGSNPPAPIRSDRRPDAATIRTIRCSVPIRTRPTPPDATPLDKTPSTPLLISVRPPPFTASHREPFPPLGPTRPAAEIPRLPSLPSRPSAPSTASRLPRHDR